MNDQENRENRENKDSNGYANTTGFRETFGLTDPATGKRYPDILSAIAVTGTMNASFLTKKIIKFREHDYILHLDPKIVLSLRRLPLMCSVQVVTSYQIRTDCNIALARLYDFRLDTRLRRKNYDRC